MVTETEHPLNDRNNNNVNVYSSRTMTKETIVEDDNNNENNDIEIYDDNIKDADGDTDDENIDVGVEKSDVDDQCLSDQESTVGMGDNEIPRCDSNSIRVRHDDYNDFRTNTTSRLGIRDVPISPLPPLLPHLHHLPIPPPQPLPILQGSYHQTSDDQSCSTSPKPNTNSNNDNDSETNSCSQTMISSKSNFISKLSFGIDRILNETDSNQGYHGNHKQIIPSSRGTFESTEDTEDYSKELDNHNDVSDQDSDDDRKLLSYPERSNSISSNEAVAYSKVTTSTAAAVVNKTCLPPRMLSGVDLVSPLSPFHGAVLPRDVCRVELPSLDILPVRPAWPDVYVCPWTGVQRDRFGLVRRVGHPYQNRTPPKRKKPRTAFSRQQVLELEKRFTRQKYLASAERSALAKTLNMTDAQVKTWFQNRRTKWRRQTAEEREIERQAAHKFLLSLRPDDPNRANIAAYGALCGVNQQGPQHASEAPKSPGASSVN